nr:glycosyltransferase family 39 protein [Ktedonobacteraceae bacterium]
MKPLTKNTQSHDEGKEGSAAQTDTRSHHGLRPGIEWFIVPVLALIALIPRIILARQLDLVTDEIIYIMGGKGYLPLVLHHNFTSVGWEFNYEHPPLVKLLIGLSIYLNTQFVHRANELFVARIPSILSGTILIIAIYWLGRKPFGRVVAILAALALAVSP